MKFKNPYFTPKEQISTLQRWILLHSFLYYSIDKPIVSDQTFDNNCKQLVDLMWDHNEETRYSKIFKDFDGSTGFDLFDKCDYTLKVLIRENAEQLLKGRK